MKRTIPLLASLGLLAPALTSCFPVPTYGPGSNGYSCADRHTTVWLAERPASADYASFTLGMKLCTQFGSSIVSADPYDSINKMGLYAPLMNAGLDYVRTDHLNPASVTVEAGSFGQLCMASKYIGFTCSFMDHVHLWLTYTVPGAIGGNGPSFTTDRGDITVKWTP